MGLPSASVDGPPPALFTEFVAYASAELGAEIVLHTDFTSTRLRTELSRRKLSLAILACHGRFAEDDPRRSALLLADGPFTVAQALREEGLLSVDHLVLCACESAVPSSMDEALSLPGAFVAAGVASVLGTRCSVYSLPSVLFIGHYLKSIRLGKPKSHALREAADWLRNATRAEIVATIDELERAHAHKDFRPSVATFNREQLGSGHPDQGLTYQLDHVYNPEGAERPFASARYWAAFAVHGSG